MAGYGESFDYSLEAEAESQSSELTEEENMTPLMSQSPNRPRTAEAVLKASRLRASGATTDRSPDLEQTGVSAFAKGAQDLLAGDSLSSIEGLLDSLCREEDSPRAERTSDDGGDAAKDAEKVDAELSTSDVDPEKDFRMPKLERRPSVEERVRRASMSEYVGRSSLEVCNPMRRVASSAGFSTSFDQPVQRSSLERTSHSSDPLLDESLEVEHEKETPRDVVDAAKQQLAWDEREDDDKQDGAPRQQGDAGLVSPVLDRAEAIRQAAEAIKAHERQVKRRQLEEEELKKNEVDAPPVVTGVSIRAVASAVDAGSDKTEDLYEDDFDQDFDQGHHDVESHLSSALEPQTLRPRETQFQAAEPSSGVSPTNEGMAPAPGSPPRSAPKPVEAATPHRLWSRRPLFNSFGDELREARRKILALAESGSTGVNVKTLTSMLREYPTAYNTAEKLRRERTHDAARLDVEWLRSELASSLEREAACNDWYDAAARVSKTTSVSSGALWAALDADDTTLFKSRADIERALRQNLRSTGLDQDDFISRNRVLDVLRCSIDLASVAPSPPPPRRGADAAVAQARGRTEGDSSNNNNDDNGCDDTLSLLNAANNNNNNNNAVRGASTYADKPVLEATMENDDDDIVRRAGGGYSNESFLNPLTQERAMPLDSVRERGASEHDSSSAGVSNDPTKPSWLERDDDGSEPPPRFATAPLPGVSAETPRTDSQLTHPMTGTSGSAPLFRADAPPPHHPAPRSATRFRSNIAAASLSFVGDSWADLDDDDRNNNSRNGAWTDHFHRTHSLTADVSKRPLPVPSLEEPVVGGAPETTQQRAVESPPHREVPGETDTSNVVELAARVLARAVDMMLERDREQAKAGGEDLIADLVAALAQEITVRKLARPRTIPIRVLTSNARIPRTTKAGPPSLSEKPSPPPMFRAPVFIENKSDQPASQLKIRLLRMRRSRSRLYAEKVKKTQTKPATGNEQHPKNKIARWEAAAFEASGLFAKRAKPVPACVPPCDDDGLAHDFCFQSQFFDMTSRFAAATRDDADHSQLGASDLIMRNAIAEILRERFADRASMSEIRQQARAKLAIRSDRTGRDAISLAERCRSR